MSEMLLYAIAELLNALEIAATALHKYDPQAERAARRIAAKYRHFKPS